MWSLAGASLHSPQLALSPDTLDPITDAPSHAYPRYLFAPARAYAADRPSTFPGVRSRRASADWQAGAIAAAAP